MSLHLEGGGVGGGGGGGVCERERGRGGQREIIILNTSNNLTRSHNYDFN